MTSFLYVFQKNNYLSAPELLIFLTKTKLYMKKISLVIATLLIAFSLSASAIFSGNPSADNVMLPLFHSGKTISLAKFMTLNASEYKTLTGSKMTFKEKVTLKLFQRHFKNSINSDGTVDLKKFRQDQGDASHAIGWFLLGFLLGIIGLIIALVINDDNRRDRIRWTLIGWGVWVALLVVLFAAAS
jgi:hypothetical protein